MKKLSVKLFAMVLVVAMLCSLLPGIAFAADFKGNLEKIEPTGDAMSLSLGETETKSTKAAEKTYSYSLVRSAKDLTAGEYVIVTAATGPYAGSFDYYAMTTVEDSTYAMILSAGQSFTAIPPILNVAESIRGEFAWNIQGNASGLTMKNSAGTYLTATQGSSGLYITSTPTNWVGTYYADKAAFTLGAYGRYLALRTDVGVVCDNGRIGYATSVPDTADQYMYLYKKVELPDMKSVVLYHTLDLATDITLNYAVSKNEFKVFDKIWMKIDRPIYEGNTLVETETSVLEPIEKGDYYYFALEGMTAIHMNDMIQAVVCGQKDGVDYMTETDTYSIGTYAYNQMAKEDATPELRAVCAELLRYGGKSQLFKGYRTDALVDGAMTEVQKSYLTSLEDVEFGSCNQTMNDLPGASAIWKGKSLDLQSKVSLRMILDLSRYTGSVDEVSVRVSYIDMDGKERVSIIENHEVYREDKGLYAFDFSDLRIAELRTVLSAAAYCGDTQISATLQYSMDTYGKGKTGDLLVTCQALVAYADAAHNYFAS